LAPEVLSSRRQNSGMKTRARPRCRQKIIKGFHQSSNDCLTRIDCRNDTCFKPLQKVPAHAASRGVPKLGTVTVARLVAGDASLLVSCQPFEFSLSPCAQVLVSPCKSLLFPPQTSSAATEASELHHEPQQNHGQTSTLVKSLQQRCHASNAKPPGPRQVDSGVWPGPAD